MPGNAAGMQWRRPGVEITIVVRIIVARFMKGFFGDLVNDVAIWFF
jgi:hypothetical protein